MKFLCFTRSKNTTIAHCRPTHGIARKRHRTFTITRHQSEILVVTYIQAEHASEILVLITYVRAEQASELFVLVTNVRAEQESEILVLIAYVRAEQASEILVLITYV